MSYVKISAIQAARNGAAFLDAELGPGWEQWIDTDSLELSDTCNCVLGQVYMGLHPRARKNTRSGSPFGRLAKKLGLRPKDVFDSDRIAELGFDAWNSSPTYRGLNSAWRRIIRERQGSTVSA